MNILELPAKLFNNYLRFVGLMLLIVYGLWLRFWENIQPTIRPVRDVYDNVNHKGISLAGIVEQCLRVILMACILYVKCVVAVWETVSRPFRPQVEAVKRFFEDVENEYHRITPKTD